MSEPRKKNLKCCLCNAEITHVGFEEGEYLGNNPWPLSIIPDARCCDNCNDMLVIPARLAQMQSNNG